MAVGHLEQYLRIKSPFPLLKVLLMKNTYRFIFVLITSMFFLHAEGQFYNGHQMSFGKNRVQYFDYYWSFYRFEDFDCYFNEYGRDLAQFTADYAFRKLDEIEDYFDYTLEKGSIHHYNKNNEYRQSNDATLMKIRTTPVDSAG
jgi:hypothetical protein